MTPMPDDLGASVSSEAQDNEPGIDEIPFEADIETIRRLATVLPGDLPTAINAISVAESIRPRKFVVAGGGDEPCPMPRTAYQLVYPDGTLMLDSGLDKETHESFGKGEAEPYYPDQYDLLQKALKQARTIFVSHYHGDHAGGVVVSPDFEELAKKTIICAETARLLVEEPHRPHLAITQEQVENFIIIDYPLHTPIAPGLVAIKSPGHSPDSQMVYIKMADGQEFFHAFDTAWNMDNINLIQPKAAPWVEEDQPPIMGQLRWMNALKTTHPEIKFLVAHDDKLFGEFEETGQVGLELQLD